MSYDVYIEIDTGGPEPAILCDDMNYTFNCSPMFRDALGGNGINDLHDKACGDAIPMLRRAVADMEDRPAHYKKMNPDNGWGDYSGALSFLRAILDRCVQHPKATVRVSA